jgi:replication-associated recombination protein RarA
MGRCVYGQRRKGIGRRKESAMNARTDWPRLYQALAPRSLDEVCGQDRAIAQTKGILAAVGLGGNAVWINGPSGHGKSLIAGLLAREFAAKQWVTDVDAGRVTAAMIDRWEPIVHALPLPIDGKAGRVFILQEAHGLKPSVMRRLLVLLEALPRHVAFIFTTTRDGQEMLFEDQTDAGPLLSRCFEIRLNHAGMADPVAEYLHKRIPQVLGVNGQPLSWYKRKIQDANNNVRKAIQDIVLALAAKQPDSSGRG